jgi:hypothetical protein
MKVVAECAVELRLLKNQSLGHTYTRYNKDEKRKEYLSYAGGNESMWTNNLAFFDRNCNASQIFGPGKPCLNLKSVCWMDPWAIIENVTIPNAGPLVLSVFFYHSYGVRFIMNVTFRIRIAEQPAVLTRGYMS